MKSTFLVGFLSLKELFVRNIALPIIELAESHKYKTSVELQSSSMNDSS